ncbi:MAG: hypothetical protein A3C06_01090 [Candidatus Taylorbacteria bacterium RIFCSPHIGHO2_02_FULL_46_13]|uniref:Uncharacterized protein n=1 Tax=Candidatus Taylorbacteria bacterium RIFCSPHIGHO2_02_FULL_46_13 TaxID=1802312 RepID=A0A1G2MT59_9BACT|nr:MAG: hypothetical protein A3C06_01090 [Candidatus Taylorbacteria bacterium RIFCSPHIGHO2_02_FULL_46_13]
MTELLNFEGQLLEDLTPVVSRLVSQERAKGARLFLDESGTSIVIKAGSKKESSLLSRSIKSRGMGVAEDHFAHADGAPSDGLAWRYADDSGVVA